MRRVKFRDRKQSLESVRYDLALVLFQRCQDDKGNKIPTFTAEEVRRMSPKEKRKLRLAGWGADLSRDDFINLRIPLPKLFTDPRRHDGTGNDERPAKSRLSVVVTSPTLTSQSEMALNRSRRRSLLENVLTPPTFGH